MAERFALIVAADQYNDGKLRQLRAPAHDAAELRTVLSDSNIGSFTVKSILNESAQQVQEEVEQFFKQREPEDLLLLYFACHGVKDQRGRLYLAMPDTKLELIASTGVAAHFINEQMEASRSRRIVLILDCCYSGAYARGFAPRSDTRVGVCESFEGHGRVVLTASDALEYAFEDDELRTEMQHSSIYTGAMVRGLRTGDADLDRDGRVSVDDLYSFTYREVRARTPNQTPSKVDMVRGSIYLAANPRIEASSISSSVDPFRAVTSDRRWQREEAALELRKLTEDADAVVAQAAQAALQRLTADRERLVRASARAALGDVILSHFERGLVLASSGDLMGADSEFEKVTDSSATQLSAFAYFNRGVLAAAVDRMDDAERYYTAALQSDESLAAARGALNLACLHEAAGDYERAMAEYETAISYDDSVVEPRAAYLLGRLNEKRGDLSKAWFFYGKAADYDGHPFKAAAMSRYRALMPSATEADILTRVLAVSGFSNPAARARLWLADHSRRDFFKYKALGEAHDTKARFINIFRIPKRNPERTKIITDKEPEE